MREMKIYNTFSTQFAKIELFTNFGLKHVVKNVLYYQDVCLSQYDNYYGLFKFKTRQCFEVALWEHFKKSKILG